jgi:hypothetical protein
MSSVIASSVAEHHPGPQTQERGQRAVFCGLTSIYGCIVVFRTPSSLLLARELVRTLFNRRLA